jgi:Flp pilus assembly protein CpaB
MTVSKTRRSRGPGWFMVVVVLAGIVLLGSVVAVAYVASGGEIPIPFSNPPRYFSLAKKVEEKPWTPPVGKVAVPVSGRTVAAYSKVNRDDLWDAKNQKWMVAYVDPSSLQGDDAFVSDAGKIFGRVLAREKSKGYAFRESDFLPEGTRPGLVAGIPAGYRGVRIELSKVRGLYGLQPGDHFDLISTIPVANDASQDLRKMGGAYGDRLAIEASFANVSKQATVRVVVQAGLVVTPVTTVEIPVTMASLTQGNRVNSKPLQEVVIAVHPEEVAPLTEAMAVDADLAVVPRSGRPDDPKDSKTPELHPRNPFTAGDGKEGPAALKFVETIGGTNRELVPVPTSGDSKETPPHDKK